MKEHIIKIEGGVSEFVYDDQLASLAAMGRVQRASHVEPHPTRPGWIADMAPSGGPVLGEGGVEGYRAHKNCDCEACELVVLAVPPFATRDAALVAERAWLRRERGL